MNERDLARRLRPEFGATLDPTVMRQGVVTAVTTGPPNSLSVALGGSTTSIDGVRYLSSYTPVVNDVVFVLVSGADLLVLGILSTFGGGGQIGSITLYAGAAAPDGWLLCDGSAVSRTTYADLFAVTSTTYGVGDGSTTFNIPDLRGRVPVGAGTGAGLSARALAATGGEESHYLSTPEMPSHSHGADVVQGGGTSPPANITQGGGQFESTSLPSAGGGGSHNNMQPWQAITYIICVA